MRETWKNQVREKRKENRSDMIVGGGVFEACEWENWQWVWLCGGTVAFQRRSQRKQMVSTQVRGEGKSVDWGLELLQKTAAISCHV